ncbi:HK97 family phage prohead protease [Bradyrhizobium sp. CCGB01]|uniref:HK97 family phage prohead protease n=1 Tax=Bradyrhizobium sp. CCGB01 TaxID=2949634 RepID=UPI0020B1B8C6|nr:HK97 family phage prohead protease [Bradyrhizobium sp. CCGB01]MCP3406211.1 HK97 family phage prohead protease [Bradyrhizobium sp. CCGB01]
MADSVISGYAIVYNSPTVIAGEWREQLAPGSLTRTLKESPDVVMILSHDIGRVLGRVSAGTLALREDRVGLYFALTVDPSTPEGQTALGTVGRQDVKGCSFGFRVRAEEWKDGGDRLPLRTITDLDLYELTLTALPAYEETSASLRASSNNDAAVRRIREAQRRRGILK